MRYLSTAVLALALIFSASPLLAADVSDGLYVQGQGGYYRKDDRSGPYTVGPDGQARLLSPVAESDVTESRTLNAAVLNSQQTYVLNSHATFSFNFQGLAASGATVSFLQSNDYNPATGIGTFTGVSEVNTGTGLPTLTRNTDGQSAVGVEGNRAVRVQVTTAGSGTITLASNLSVRSRYAAIRSPVPGIAATPNAVSPVPVVGRAVTSLVAKASAGNLYGLSLTQGATAGFFALLDATSAPAASAAITPVECIPVAANAYYRTRSTIPDRYNSGLVVLSTSSCTTFTAVTPVLIGVVAQ